MVRAVDQTSADGHEQRRARTKDEGWHAAGSLSGLSASRVLARLASTCWLRCIRFRGCALVSCVFVLSSGVTCDGRKRTVVNNSVESD